MQADVKELMQTGGPVLLAITLAVGGFALMRMAALWESYVLLFVSFSFMFVGIVMLFGNGHHHRPQTRSMLGSVRRPLWRRRAARD